MSQARVEELNMTFTILVWVIGLMASLTETDNTRNDVDRGWMTKCPASDNRKGT